MPYSSIRPPQGYTIQYLAVTESTNTHLLRLAREGAPHGQVLIAGAQTNGKGSRGRDFFSPQGGLYLSILLREVPEKKLGLLTSLTAVAVLRTLKRFTDKELSLKWVNDIYLADKKVCGILCESAFQGKSAVTIVGIGINLSPPAGGFPDGFRYPPTALFDKKADNMAPLIAERLLAEFDALYQSADFIKEYRENCCTLGRRVTLCRGEELLEGEAVGIDETGGLIVRTDDGNLQTFASGEVTSQSEVISNENRN